MNPQEDLQKVIDDNNSQFNFEAILYRDNLKEEEINPPTEEPKEESKDKPKEDSSSNLFEVDNRTITPEIIDIIKKEIFDKYRINGENKLNELKIISEENFLENQTLLNVADLLGIKKIKFVDVETNIFNTLLPENSLMVKKFKRIKLEKEQEKNENKIEEEISLEEVKFKNCKIDADFSGIFPLIKKFTLKNCKIPYEIASKLNFNYLSELILENLGLIDDNIKSIFNQIKRNNHLKNNLIKISFKNNDISLIDPCQDLEDNKILEKLGLCNLEVLDLSNNKIVFISTKMVNALKSLKLIDLTNNSIVFPSGYSSYIDAAKKKNFLVLLTKNYALLNNSYKEDYVNYLTNIMDKIDYDFISISLVNLYIGKCYEKMMKLNLSKFSQSLIELDISYGNINDNDLNNLLKGNLALHNLKNLNLAKNKLTDKLLDIFVENNFQKEFPQLKILNLSGNKLGFKVAINYQNFFEKFISLKLFIVKNTPFELSINNYTRTLINRYYEMERKKEYKTEFTKEDFEIQKIINNDNYLIKKTNVTIYLIDTNNYKYVSKIKKYFPDILQRINFETRFYDNK